MEEVNLTETLLTAEINSIITSPTRYAEMSAAAKAFAPEGAALKLLIYYLRSVLNTKTLNYV